MFALKTLLNYKFHKSLKHSHKTRFLSTGAFPALLSAVLILSTLFCTGITARADEETEARLAAHRAMPVESNEIFNWPDGPTVGAESAILIEANTGTILYSKNIHEKQYPASTTKILTTLLATELLEMDEMVTFSKDAVFDTPRDSSHIAMDVGQAITVEQCLNAILIRSANEVSFAIAETITGTTDWSVFAEIMNNRAKELGAINSNFVNPNGLPDENHYTTAYDLAMIGRAFFDNEMLCQISLTKRLDIPASDTLPHRKLENSAMKIIPGGEYAYEHIVGCKTGYTNAARFCLVSCAEKNGLKLICVVMNDENPYQYEDTISLFDYGFSNFEKVNVADTETKYNIDNTGFFYSGNDIFGNSKPILSLNENDYIILPRTITFDEAETTVSYETQNENQAAVITYSYQGMDLGTVRVNFAIDNTETYVFDTIPEEEETPPEEEETSVVFINIVRVLIGLGIVAVVIFLIALGRAFIKSYAFTGFSRNKRNRWKSIDTGHAKNRARNKKRRKRPNRFRDYDF